MSTTEISLMAHLMRRAGMGATRDELEALVTQGYEAVVDDLVHPERFSRGGPDIVHPYLHGPLPEEPSPDDKRGPAAALLSRHRRARGIVPRKVDLPHGQLEATAEGKDGPLLAPGLRVRGFEVGTSEDEPAPAGDVPARRHGRLPHGPAGTVSRPFDAVLARQQRETTRTSRTRITGESCSSCFSMGVGNYTEEDVKSSAYAFTGWSFVQPAHGAVPYGKWATRFDFREADHDYGEKTFLGVTGALDGTGRDRHGRRPARDG